MAVAHFPPSSKVVTPQEAAGLEGALKVRPGLYRLRFGRHTDRDPNQPIVALVTDPESGEKLKKVVGYHNRRFAVKPDNQGGFIPSAPFKTFDDLDQWSEKFERVFEAGGETPGTVAVPITAEVWDHTAETLEQFVERMKAKAPPAPGGDQFDAHPHSVDPIQPPRRIDPVELRVMKVKELMAVAEAEEVDVSAVNPRAGDAKEQLIALISAKLLQNG